MTDAYKAGREAGIREALAQVPDHWCSGHDTRQRILALLDNVPAPVCPTCEGHGCVATNRNGMDGFPVEIACPDCNAPAPAGVTVQEGDLTQANRLMKSLRAQGYRIPVPAILRALSEGRT